MGADPVTFIMNPYVARIFYAAVMATVLVLAWQSGRIGYQKCALWLLASWVGSNFLFAAAGPENAPYLIMPFNAYIVMNIWFNVEMNDCDMGPRIIALYGVGFAITGLAMFLLWRFNFGWLSSPSYYFCMNIVYMLRMVTAGKMSLDAIRSRTERLPLFFHSLEPRRE
jgi:hypothetical protein